MNNSTENVTLQINLCAGDVAYAEQSVPKIIANHPSIKNVLLLVDTYKPQRTKIIQPEERFPEPEYSEKVKKIKEIANSIKVEGRDVEVYFFENDDALIKVMAKKYLHQWFTHTHDTTGMAIMPYWAGIEKVKTRYVLHYDADILTFQKSGYEWVDEALEYMQANENILASTARNAPPSEKTGDVPTFHQGRPIESFDSYWTNDWFGTRCFLMDKEKLTKYLPLLKGKLFLEALVRSILNRNFPLSPEYVLFKKVGQLGGRKLILKNKNAWTLHPVYKKEGFAEKLPILYKLIESQNLPTEQLGWEDLKWDKFLSFINNKDVLM